MNQTEWLNSDDRKTDYNGVKNLSPLIYQERNRFHIMK